MTKSKMTINDIQDFNEKVLFLLYRNSVNGEQIEDFETGYFETDTKEFEEFSKLCNRLYNGIYDFEETEVVKLMNDCITSWKSQLDKIPNEATKTIIENRINELKSIANNFTNTTELNEAVDNEKTKSITLSEEYTNEEGIQKETLVTEGQQEAPADKTETTENFKEQNKKDTIIAKILIGLIAEREESESYKKIAELEQKLQNETDDNKKQEIQNQIDDLKASWNLTIENQNMDSENRLQPIKIENDLPDFITNDYKILNNQGGKTDNIYLDNEKENALNISHDKDTPVNESSIYASINALCQQMQEQEQNPFTFNFNTKTDVFKKTIYNALSQNLGTYNQMGMDAICIDGTTMSLDKFKNFASFEDFDKFTQTTENSTNENVEQPVEVSTPVNSQTADAPLQENSDDTQYEELDSVDVSVPSQEELTEYFSNDDENLDDVSLLTGEPLSNAGITGDNFQQATDIVKEKISDIDPETLKKMQRGNQNQ